MSAGRARSVAVSRGAWERLHALAAASGLGVAGEIRALAWADANVEAATAGRRRDAERARSAAVRAARLGKGAWPMPDKGTRTGRTVRVDAETWERLRALAARSGRSIADEIRTLSYADWGTRLQVEALRALATARAEGGEKR